jgi:SET domain-containing protein
MEIFVEPRVKRELLSSSSFYSFVHAWETGMDLKMLDACMIKE